MISVVGYDGGPLSALAQERLAAASLVMGGRRHLQQVALPDGVRTIALRDDPAAALAAVADETGDVVVLASGDPGFFGVVRAVRRAVRPGTVEVLPGLTSIALAFGRAGHEWDDAVVVSAHGRDPRAALAAVRSQPKVAVLTDATTGPAQIGAALAGRTDRVLLVGEHLGLPQERVSWCCPDEAAARAWEDPNVVVVLDTGDPEPGPRVTVAGFRTPQQWALPEHAFDHRDAMVTKSEVRALVLARLGPRLGDVVWDVGAASGSVGIECARFGADVHAVEKNDVGQLRANATAHDVHVHVVQGRAPEALVGLPEPDAAFVGGGGPEVVAAVAARRPERLVVALAALERVQPTLEAMAGYDTDAVLLQASRLAPLAGAHRLAPTNPVFVVTGVLSHE